MSAEPSGLTPAQSAQLTRRAMLLSVSVAATLVALKLAAWIASGSVALLASLVDSGLDLLASALTLFAVRYAAIPPDAAHRYGHGKAEAFASLLQGGLVFASAALIGREAVQALVTPHPIQREGWAIAVMLASTALTAGLLAVQTRVLKRAASVAVAGDRAHYAADLASNLIGLAGIAAAALLGVAGLDAAAGLAIAAILLWGAVGVFRQASDQLLDHELSERTRAKIVELMTQDGRVTHVHQLRTRAAGPVVHVQMHVDLDPHLSLEAAHKVIVDAENRVLSEFPSADILIHPDPRGRAEPHGGAFAESAPPAA
ncbi:cation diffusion facilitator family transporter [Phenylobacterium sp.]|jgi:cation diffusion facilitator family transporter|uniref:cation diffusion facilitator family transporter n=1 Tax=Phenylobacterium sp. TaxID=1871053 RepID=UPI002F40347E